MDCIYEDISRSELKNVILVELPSCREISQDKVHSSFWIYKSLIDLVLIHCQYIICSRQTLRLVSWLYLGFQFIIYVVITAKVF
jgi:hypothetical protein